jgi:hypothetical protein
MNTEREEELLLLTILGRAVWMGSALGAGSAFVDVGFGGNIAFAVIAIPFGAIVGLVIGTVAGFVAGAYAINARRRHTPQHVARGIHVCIMIVIAAFVILAAVISIESGAPPWNVWVTLPGATALVLGWLGSHAMSAAYLRREAKLRETA